MLKVHPCFARDILLRDDAQKSAEYTKICQSLMAAFVQSGIKMDAPLGQINLNHVYKYPPEEFAVRCASYVRNHFIRQEKQPGFVQRYGAYMLNLEDNVTGENRHASQYWNSKPDPAWAAALGAARTQVLFELKKRGITGTPIGGISGCFVTPYYFLYSTTKGNYSMVNDAHAWLFNVYQHGNPSLYIREPYAKREIWQKTMWHGKECLRLGLPCIPSVRTIYKDTHKPITVDHWLDYFEAYEYTGISSIMIWLDGYDEGEKEGIENMGIAYRDYFG